MTAPTKIRRTREEIAAAAQERQAAVAAERAQREAERQALLADVVAPKPYQMSAVVLPIVVYGDPAPQGSKSYKGQRPSKTQPGKTVAIMAESSKKVKPWRTDVKDAARVLLDKDTTGQFPLDGPLGVTVCFTLPKPISAPKTRRILPDKLPDIDKLARSTFDALKTAGAWADDARCVRLVAEKAYVGEHPMALQSPGAVIWIHRVEAAEPSAEVDLRRMTAGVPAAVGLIEGFTPTGSTWHASLSGIGGMVQFDGEFTQDLPREDVLYDTEGVEGHGATRELALVALRAAVRRVTWAMVDHLGWDEERQEPVPRLVQIQFDQAAGEMVVIAPEVGSDV